MKIKTITYAMLRSTAMYENDRVEVTMEIDPNDALGDVVRRAKKVCEAALKTQTTPTFESMVEDDADDHDNWEAKRPAKRRSR